MLCQELDVKPELVVVALDKGEHRAPPFLKLNPAHAIPVLDDNGFILAESHSIMRYLCQKQGGDRFYPSAPGPRALVDQWLDWTHCKLNPPVQTLTIQTLFAGDKKDPAVVETALSGAKEALAVLDAAIAEKRGLGGEVTIADFALSTTVALYEICGGGLDGVPSVEAWYAKIKKLPSFLATKPPIG